MHTAPEVTAEATPAIPAPALPRAHAVAGRLLGCDHLADDAVQEALIAWWRTGATPGEPTGWLVRAVVHRCRHLRRTLRRRRHHEQHAVSRHCELHRGCDNPLHVAWAHETGERLAAAINALPEGQRAVFERFEHLGNDYGAIANELALPIGTVRSRLHRARAELQHRLRERTPTRCRSAQS